MNTRTPRRSYQPHLLALEPRMMFDAAAAVAVQSLGDAAGEHAATPDAHGPAHDVVRSDGAERHGDVGPVTFDGDARTADRYDARALDAGRTEAPAREIIFIDTAVDDYRQLAAEWTDRGEVVLIDGTKDGIDQVRTALAGRSDVSAIHLVSHGEAGAFWLGTTKLDAASIGGDLAASLGAIGRSLSQGGDILIYGCDFAEGAEGARALTAFAQATHADVAASTDVTGFASRGGDWVLEANRGSIETHALSSTDWVHTLDPNTPVPISVTTDSLIVTDGSGTVVVSGTTGYGNDGRSPDVGMGAVALWTGAATYQGRSIDLRATVVSLTSGDAVRFNRPAGGNANNGDDATFLLRDLTSGNTPATVQLRWELVDHATGDLLPADVRFTIADIDGIGGNPNTRETVTASTQSLAYYTRDRDSDIHFNSTLDTIEASGTQDENNPVGPKLSPKSAASFDWTKVSAFTLTYTLAPNNVATQAQFYHDGDADFVYDNPVYTSIPRLDLDGDDSTATGNDAHFTFTENGPGVPIVDGDVVVANPMDIASITGATVTLTNYKDGDGFTVGTLPANVSYSVGSVNNGTLRLTFTGTGSESDYRQALQAVRFTNGSDTPDTTQRVISVAFSNDTLTSASAISRIDVIPVNDPPVAVDDSATVAEDGSVVVRVLDNDSDPEGDTLTVTAATALHGDVVRNPDGTLTYTPFHDYNGADTISYTIADGHGGTAQAQVAITVTPVNDAPVPVGTLPARSTQDAATVSWATASGFNDVDGDALHYSATGLPAGLTIDAATGVISGTVDRSASQPGGGRYTVTVTARDPSNAAATQAFTITVADPAPVATDDSATTAEDTAVTIPVLANDRDPDGDPLTVTSATALHGRVAINPDGTLTYTPDANYNGADTISYAIADGQGGTAVARVAVTITPVNDAPAGVGTLPARSGVDGGTTSFATAGAFTDVDGDTLTYSAANLPAGLAIDPASGVVSGTIDRSASQRSGGSYTVVVTARDPSGQRATQSFVFTVTDPAPVATNDGVTTAEDTPVTIAVLANDRDPDGDPLTVTGASALHGRIAINADGTLTYTPDADYNGTDTIDYAISDGEGGTAHAQVAVTITPVNDAPRVTAIPSTYTTQDGATVNVSIAPAFTDVDGDRLTYAVSGLPQGLTLDPATGIVSGTIDRSASRQGGGVYSVVLTATDPSNASATQTITLTVTNPAPVARDDSATTAEDTPVTIAVLGNDSDPDGDPLTVVSASAGHGSVAINADGTLRYTPDRDFNGSDTITYTIDDGDGGRATARVAVTVTPVDDAPTAATLPAQTTVDGAAVSTPLAGFFADVDGDALTYTAIGLPTGLSIDPATGVISGTIADGSANGGAAGDGVFHVVVTATDPAGLHVDAPFDWTIAQSPPVAVDDRATTPEDVAVRIPVLANDRDPDGDPLTIVGATADHGVVTIDGGALVFTPAANFNGDATIVYTVADPGGRRATATVVVTVTPVADAPVATPIAIDGARDGQAISLPVGGFFADPDGDALRFAATGLPAGLTMDPATGTITGTIDRNASRAAGGVYHVVVTATDPSGLAVDSAFDWTIVNPAPVSVDDAATVIEDTATTIAVLANDRDPDGDPLTVVAASAGHGRVAINPDGTLSYTPDADFSGSDVIVYTIADSDVGRASASVLVTVTPVEDAPRPIGTPIVATVMDGATVALDAGAWFFDPDGDRLRYAATGLPAGLSIDPATGAIAGTIDRSASQIAGGVYHVIVTATDPAGESGAQRVTLRVADPAPIAADDAARTDQRVGITIPVLANDRDPDGDPLTVVAAVADHGTVTINPDGSVRYVPADSFAGTDTIRYTIADGDGGTATAVVTIVVDPVNRAPVVPGRDPLDAVGGRPSIIDALAGVADPDGDPLTITGATAANGIVRVNRDGTLTFTPALGFVGTTTITYTVADGKGGVTTATLVVRVADGRGADIEELLRIGRVSFRDPAPAAARVTLTDGLVRNPLALIGAVEDVRSLRSTAIGGTPVLDAVEAIRSLRTTTIDPDAPIAAEVARLDAIRDQRDAGDRLFDQRWGDFLVRGLTGFSAAADRQACIMVESVVRGSALYIEVRDTAAEGSRAPIRSVDLGMADGRKLPDWISVDHRGLAIVERAANLDELHLVVRVTRTDGRTSATPIVVQGATGEIELDRHAHRAAHRSPAPQPLDAMLHTPAAAVATDAARLASHFE